MSNALSPSASAPPAQEPLRWLLPRGESTLLIATDCDVGVEVDGGTLATRFTQTVPGRSTLILSSGDRPLHVHSPGAQRLAVAPEMLRLLAFHDHVTGLQRPLPRDRRQPAALVAEGDFNDAQTAHQWLVRALLDGQPAFLVAASLWATREPYQLIRFVLEHPDLGVQQLADRYGLSVAQFRRIGRKAFGRSLKEQLRLLRAGRVLHRHADTGHTFTRLSSDFGFSSPSHFCSEIKALLGRSPSAIFQHVHAP